MLIKDTGKPSVSDPRPETKIYEEIKNGRVCVTVKYAPSPTHTRLSKMKTDRSCELLLPGRPPCSSLLHPSPPLQSQRVERHQQTEHLCIILQSPTTLLLSLSYLLPLNHPPLLLLLAPLHLWCNPDTSQYRATQSELQRITNRSTTEPVTHL